MTQQRCVFCNAKLETMVINRCCHSDKKKNPSLLSPGTDESGPGYPFSETPFKEKFHPNERYFSELGKDKTGPKVVKSMEHYVANEWDAKAFLNNWHHIPISRSGKVKTTLYNECCNGDCDIQEINETGLDQRCCDQGCRYQEVLDF